MICLLVLPFPSLVTPSDARPWAAACQLWPVELPLKAARRLLPGKAKAAPLWAARGCEWVMGSLDGRLGPTPAMTGTASRLSAPAPTRALPVNNHRQHLVPNPSNKALNTHRLSRQTEDITAFLSLGFSSPFPPASKLPDCVPSRRTRVTTARLVLCPRRRHHDGTREL